MIHLTVKRTKMNRNNHKSNMTEESGAINYHAKIENREQVK